MGKTTSFKICPSCGFRWKTRDEFIRDENVIIIGYQASLKRLKAGIFLFNHSCRGTLALDVESFVDMFKGPIFRERMTGTDECPEYCLHKNELSPCPAKCECASVREIIQVLKK